MTKTFTPDDLIRYLYRETSELEDREVENALLCDSKLAELFKELNLTIKSLDSIFEELASDRAVENILNYSKSMHCHTVN